MTTRPTSTAEILPYVDALVPRLAERAAEAEALRRLPGATLRDADEAGFLAMLTPKRWGGAGAEVSEFLEATRRLAHGCASSACTLSFLSLHSWPLCRFEPRCQEKLVANETWGKVMTSLGDGNSRSRKREKPAE